MNTLSKMATTILATFLLAANISYAQAQSGKAGQVIQGNSTTLAPIEPSDLVNAAMRIASAMSTSAAGKLWDNASVVAKRSIKRADFVAKIEAGRQAKGPVTSRDWTGLRRQVSSGGELPPGGYATVEMQVRYESGRIGHELVSFRHDEDGVWRFVGYVNK